MGRAIFIEEPRPGQRDMERVVAHDLVPLVLCPRDVRRPGVMNVQPYAEHVLERLCEVGYDPVVDLLVLTGPVLVLQFATMAALVRYGHVRLLVFHSVSDVYVEREFDAGWFERKDESHAAHQRTRP